MNFNGFLENIYFGHLDDDIFRSLGHKPAGGSVRELIDRFNAISKDFPASDLERNGEVPDQLLTELKNLGFFGIDIPADYGGLGFTIRQYLQVVQHVAGRNLDIGFTALAHLSIGTKAISLFGTEKQKQKYLVPAASGDMIFSFALTEPRIGSDARNIETTAVLDDSGDFYILNGQKTYITNANYAGGLTVFAQLDGQPRGHLGAFIVETHWDGVQIGREMPKMGLKASSTAAIKFTDVRIPKENLLGQPGEGFKIAMTVLNYGRVALGAASAGVMKLSLRDMINRARRRIQFSAPIHSFQLIQEKIVTAMVNSYAISAMTEMAAAMLARNPFAPVAIESSHCKLFGTTRAWDTLYDALQVAGGSGYLSTNPYEKRMRDFRVTTIFEGTTEIHSIYPALYFMREVAAHHKSAGSKISAMLGLLLKSFFIRSRWQVRFADKSMRQAARVGKKLARRIRFMVLTGMLLFREKVFERQYFLRRITYLSVYLFAVISMLARIETGRRAGLTISEDLRLLALFTEQARQAAQINFSWIGREDRLKDKIMDLVNTKEAEIEKAVDIPKKHAEFVQL